MKAIKNEKRNYSLAIPLTNEEIEELDKFTKQRGLKKGHFVRQAILEKLGKDSTIVAFSRKNQEE
jgi:hypothetical protein